MSAETETEIDGLIVDKVVTKLGTTVLDRVTRVVHPGERLVFVVEARLGDLGHPLGDDGSPKHRLQKLSIVDVWESEGQEGAELRRKFRNRALAEENASTGVMPFDDTVQAAQYVTSDGTVMTPAEIAEQRGEKWDPEAERTVVLVKDDGTEMRAFWPDDWAGTAQSLSAVGGFMRLPDGDPGEVAQVVELLDPESGEPVATWTEEDEEAREAAEEAKEDRLATEQLEAARTAAQAGDAEDESWEDGYPQGAGDDEGGED